MTDPHLSDKNLTPDGQTPDALEPEPDTEAPAGVNDPDPDEAGTDEPLTSM